MDDQIRRSEQPMSPSGFLLRPDAINDPVTTNRPRSASSPELPRGVPARRIWLVVGAGISFEPPANLPLWNDIKASTVLEILKTLAGFDRVVWRNAQYRYRFAQQAIELPKYPALFPEMIMESLCRAFGRRSIQDQLARLLSPA